MEYSVFAELVKARRTHMFVDPSRDVPATVIDELCELATWAPNHKRTWPWRFASLTGDARARLGAAFADDMAAVGYGDEGKRAKTRLKYTRTPTVLVVASAAHDNDLFDLENQYSVAAGVQNLLLGATALGLATFWGTPPLADAPTALELCGFEPTDRFIAVIYVGWAERTIEPLGRPDANVRHIS